MLLTVFILFGCAPKQGAYVIPDRINKRAHVWIYNEASRCLGLDRDASQGGLRINGDKGANAMADGDGNVILTEGLFDYPDETLGFVISHELAHVKLRHLNKRKGASLAITGVMVAVGFIVPGAGSLNHLVNPAVVNNYSKVQEDEADMLAYKTCLCIKMTKKHVLHGMTAVRPEATGSGGGFFDTHRSWTDRIETIRNAP